MTEYVDLSERVTATFYSDEYEEWTQQTVTIADVLDSVCEAYTVLPSAQPEIIRCKDCKYADDDCVCQHSMGLVIQDDDDYCSYAERRTDGRD